MQTLFKRLNILFVPHARSRIFSFEFLEKKNTQKKPTGQNDIMNKIWQKNRDLLIIILRAVCMNRERKTIFAAISLIHNEFICYLSSILHLLT